MQSTTSRKQKDKGNNPESRVEDIKLGDIRKDGGTQPRARLDEETINTYTQCILDGDQFPPVKLFYDGESYWLADGFHRAKAHERAKRKNIKAEVTSGTRRDAILFCVGANSTHGLRRSNADKRRAVETLLNDPEWQQWSNYEIASRSNVSHTYVRQIRNELFGDKEQTETNPSNVTPDSGQRFATRGGKTYLVNTSNIGKTTASPKPTRKRQTKIPDPTPQPIVVKPKKVKSGDTWLLGNHHQLFCGSHASQKFQSLLPEDIDLLLVFPGEPEEWLPSLPRQATSALMFYTPYGDDMHLEQLRSIVSNSVSSTTDADDMVVVLNLPDPSLFILLDGLQCKCYCAEPDPQRCTDALTAWSITQKPSKQI